MIYYQIKSQLVEMFDGTIPSVVDLVKQSAPEAFKNARSNDIGIFLVALIEYAEASDKVRNCDIEMLRKIKPYIKGTYVKWQNV